MDIVSAFELDSSPRKVNLAVSTCQTNEGIPWKPAMINVAEHIIAVMDPPPENKYLQYFGYQPFVKAASELLLGEENPAFAQNMVLGIQTVDGTEALKLGGEYLTNILSHRVCYTSQPARKDQSLVFEDIRFNSHKRYRYWDLVKKQLDMKGLLEDLQSAPENAVVVLQACGHNPTGMDPSTEDWKEIARVMKNRKLFPFFDCAYQGLASSNLEKDAWPVQYFVECGFKLLAAQSFCNNFGLYDKQVGHLTLLVDDVPNARIGMARIIKSLNRNLSSDGALVARMMIDSQFIFHYWKLDLCHMTDYFNTMRNKLREHLIKLKTPGDWDHLTHQIGMFSATGLNTRQVDFLRAEHSVYVLNGGYINVSSLNDGNIKYVANSIHDTVTKTQQ